MTTQVSAVDSCVPNYLWRRILFLSLALTSSAAATIALYLILSANGLTWLEVGMIIAFVLTLQFNVIGFWNSIIGAAILAGSRDPVKTLMPLARDASPQGPITGRTAIIMPVFNEDPALVFRNMRAIETTISQGQNASKFAFFILSDTRDPEIIAEEKAQVEGWRRHHPHRDHIHYRRRRDNTDQKAGNIWDFVEAEGDRFDYMLVLDADSVMSGKTIEWLVRIMDADPKLGILQTLTAGLPSPSLFARVLQFGMRHVMRAFTIGSCWWQGPNGSYWGHNALIRIQPFKEHCRLPQLAGEPPLGGRILSHDQVEGALIQAAGYEVRVLPEECESFEDTPPSLADFIKRDLRWCQGNMQYRKLVAAPGFQTMGRVQLALAMMNYLTSPCWIIFVTLGLIQALAVALGYPPATVIGTATGAQSAAFGIDYGTVGLALLGAVLTMNFAPKLVGFFAVLWRRETRQAYGGGWRLLTSMAVEFLMSLMLAPIIAVAQTVFLFRLFVFKEAVIWDAQARGRNVVPLADAIVRLWPQLAFGLVVAASVGFAAPAILPWLAPIIVGCVLAAPLMWLTSLESIGTLAQRVGLCTIPEEQRLVPVLEYAGYSEGTKHSPEPHAVTVFKAASVASN